MRDAADAKTISASSVSNVKIEMANNNRISDDYDADGFISRLAEEPDKSYQIVSKGQSRIKD